MIGTDDVQLAASGTTTANFNDPNVANATTVTVTNLTLSGNAASNYTLLNPTETAIATITKASLVITTNNVNMVYGGAIPSFSVYYNGFVAGRPRPS